jgi:type III pantothenate kinase
MLLAVDIGNTSTKFGLFDGDKPASKFSVPTIRNASLDEFKRALNGRLPENIGSSILCSVVPENTAPLSSFLAETTGVAPVVVDNMFDFGLKVSYEPRNSLGTDRLVNAYAAVETYGAPAIICSLGTATTIDVVSADREFVGGIIGPGMDAMAEALHLKAPRLPLVKIDESARLLGNTTESSIRSGIYFGYAAMVEGLITRIRSEAGVSRVIGTGGNAERLGKEFAGMMTVDSDLLLTGLRLLATVASK